MQQSKTNLEKTGTVVESLPNIMFRVRLDNEPVSADPCCAEGSSEARDSGEAKEILSYLSGKMRLHRIRVLVGDKVLLELEPYGGKARIIKRL